MVRTPQPNISITEYQEALHPPNRIRREIGTAETLPKLIKHAAHRSPAFVLSVHDRPMPGVTGKMDLLTLTLDR